LSPKLSGFRRFDPTIDEYRVETEDRQELFGRILSVCSGCEFRVTSENRAFVISLANEFENKELIALCFDALGDALTPESAADRLRLKICLGMEAEVELDFLASHFHELGSYVLDSFDCDVLSVILSRESLVVSSEDSLFQFIATRFAKRDDFFRLVELVVFGCLSRDSIRAFVDLARGRLHLMTSQIWDLIGSRLSSSAPDLQVSKRILCRDFVLEQGKPLSGIIAHLTEKCGENVHDKGIVNITSSTTLNGNFLARNIADLTSDNRFSSNNVQAQTVTLDFKQMIVIPTHYTIRTHEYGQGNVHMKWWVIEASIDGQEWEEIDRRNNDGHLNGPKCVHSYEISKVRRCRYIRISSTGPNHRGDNCISFSAFELFGGLIE
jgi:hypothetical protein